LESKEPLGRKKRKDGIRSRVRGERDAPTEEDGKINLEGQVEKEGIWSF